MGVSIEFLNTHCLPPAHVLELLRPRQIPFRAPFFILPRARVSPEPNFAYDATHPVARASAFMRTSVEHYVREASAQLDVTLFQLSGFLFSPQSEEARSRRAALGNTPDQIVPFLQRIEVGNPPRPQGQSGSSAGAAAALPSFKVKCHAVDSLGRKLASLADDSVTYQHVVLSHVPAVSGGDVCLPANPAAASLEFYGYLSELSKAKVKGRVTRSHVSYVEICAADTADQIVVVVDGSICGPYYSITIGPFMNPDGASVATLPVASFFPIKP